MSSSDESKGASKVKNISQAAKGPNRMGTLMRIADEVGIGSDFENSNKQNPNTRLLNQSSGKSLGKGRSKSDLSNLDDEDLE